MSIFNQEFSTGEVVRATGVSNETLQNWLKRGYLVGQKHKIEGGGSSGVHRRFSFFNLMEIATAKALIDAGVTNLTHAFKAAVSFAHVGGGAIEGIQPLRDPALPFDTTVENGITLLCVSGEKSHTHFYQFGHDPLPIIRNALGRAQGYFILEMDEVFELVMGRLGKHPQAVLEAEYNKH